MVGIVVIVRGGDKEGGSCLGLEWFYFLFLRVLGFVVCLGFRL